MNEKLKKTQMDSHLNFWDSGAQWLARPTRYSTIAGSIPTTAHDIIVLGKQFTYTFLSPPFAKSVSGHMHLKCIDYYHSAPNRLRSCNALIYELSLLWYIMMACRGIGV